VAVKKCDTFRLFYVCIERKILTDHRSFFEVVGKICSVMEEDVKETKKLALTRNFIICALSRVI
jgi:hypothetical protein